MTDGTRSRPHLADAADILHWSDRVEARTELPRLIRRLIQENNDQVVRVEMRAAEGVGVPGFDGIVEASRSTVFVPDGLSYWELSTEADPRGKANSDYRKRTEELGDGVSSDAIFVFVTSRRWAAKRGWEDGKRAEARWRDVRAFDVDDIEQALESAPAVQVWFSEMVGKPVQGAQSIEDWWSRFADRTSPPLTPDLVLAGREDTAAELIRILTQDRRFTTIGAASVDDDLAFVAATVLSADEDLRSRLLGRTLVVRDAGFLRRLDGTSNLLILAPFEDVLRREAESVRGHHLVFLSDQDSPADVALPSVDQRSFAQQLVDVGVVKNDAERYAQAAHRSLRKFQRLASRAGTAQMQEWAVQLRSRVVRRAWLAGGWNSGMSGDTDVMAALFGREYREVVDELWHAGRGADPLFSHVGGVWAAASPEDSWDYARGQVNSSDLDAVEAAIQSVLGAVDPALELPAEDRWKAGIYGKSRVHSSTLREGLATTLAIFGASGESVAFGAGSTGRDWAERVVFSLLDRANEDSTGQLWASLSDVLPLLAEAAPDVFLRVVQAALTGPAPLLRKLFADQYDGFSVSSPHTGLLWALETLAWSGAHFGLSTEHLARLAELDPGGRLSNRPLQSLADIFRPWLPQTSASMASRLSVLKRLVARHTVIGWMLLLGLLPERYQSWLVPNQAPRFRHWKPADEGVTRQEFWEFSSAVAVQILEFVEREPARWTDVAERLSDLPPNERARAFALLEDLSGGTLPEDVRAAVWEALDEQLRRHRAFPDAVWVLPSTELDRLEHALDALKPIDPLQRHKWLFDDSFPDVGEGMRDDRDAYTAEVARLRMAAVIELVDQRGLPVLSRLASRVSQPWALGVALADTDGQVEPTEVIELLDSEDPKQVEFAYAYVVRASQERLDWLLPFADGLTGRPTVQARLLAASDELTDAWDAANRLGLEVDAAYWKGFRTLGRGTDFNHVNDTARQLVAHGRPAAALDLLALYRDQANDPVEPQTVVDAFEALLSQEDEETRLLLSNWEIERLLEFLRHSPLDEDALAILEWRLLPAIGIESSAPILERKLARDPAFFVEILSLCFRSESGESERKIHPQVAQNAFRLLLDWKQIPGSDEPGSKVDEDRLRAWVTDAGPLLTEANRVVIGEQYIGKVFAHARIDDDGIWPTLPVRNMIEEMASTQVEIGFHTGAVNKRGVTSRGLDDGGAQEYKLATDYDRWAESVADQWPRTAAALRSLADSYRVEARTHDEDARRFREGLDR